MHGRWTARLGGTLGRDERSEKQFDEIETDGHVAARDCREHAHRQHGDGKQPDSTAFPQSFQKNSYSEHDIDILRNIASYLAKSLENAKLHEDLQKKVKRRTKEISFQNKDIEWPTEVAKNTARRWRAVIMLYEPRVSSMG